jgi:hypothetical protein
MELYACNNHAASLELLERKLVDYFNQLEDSDFERYYNSKSKFRNAMQGARNSIVKEKLIVPTESDLRNRNEWKLTEEGIKIGRELFTKEYGEDPWFTTEVQVENILNEAVIQLKDKEEKVFYEGKEKYILHQFKERNATLVADKKEEAMRINPLLPCEICYTSFKEKYGEIGSGFIEAHHITPISQLTEETETKLDDLILVCSNCHKIIHLKQPWLTIEEMRKLLKH